MLVIFGLLIISVIVILLITEKTSPLVALILVPLIGAILAGFGAAELQNFYLAGTKKVMQIAIMFIFAILFFGIMNDVGLFTPILNRVIKLTRGNVVLVALGTVIISTIAHLDGAGATTFLLVVPPLLPLYKRLKMNPYLLFLLLATSAGIVNMLPWGGPTGRIASVLSADVVEIYKPLIIVQIMGIGLTLILALFLGFYERARIKAGRGVINDIEDNFNEVSASPRSALIFYINLALFIVTLVVLVSGILSAGYTFMIATTLALLINYPNPKDQVQKIKDHASGAIMMAGIILAAGTFLGVLKESGMLSAIASDLVKILPNALLSQLHIIIGFLGVPLELVFSTDAYYFGLFPVVEQITHAAGVDPIKAGYAMMIGSIVGTFVSPFSPALWMGLGLAKLSMGKHIKYSFFWMWALASSLLVLSIIVGVV
ncbi:MAG: citrate:proton symporter [Helicobacter sp.]|nr:citrate:proton symporter [Helicobacter sp.]